MSFFHNNFSSALSRISLTFPLFPTCKRKRGRKQNSRKTSPFFPKNFSVQAWPHQDFQASQSSPVVMECQGRTHQESLLLWRSSHSFSWHTQSIKQTKYKCGEMIILSHDNTVIVFSVFIAGLIWYLNRILKPILLLFHSLLIYKLWGLVYYI